MSVTDCGPESAVRPRCRFQFSLRTLLIASCCLSILFALGLAVWREYADPLRYSKKFHRAIASADRVVIREGGFNCCDSVDDQKIVCEITSPEEIAELRKHLQFEPGVPSFGCMCCGYPGIDWYRGDTRIALTAVHHGVALQWNGFPADATFTLESSKWIVQWLADHGVCEFSFKQPPADVRRLIPDEFLDAIAMAQREATKQAWNPDFAAKESEEDLKDRFVRERCRDREALFSSLLRVMSVTAGPWEEIVLAEQREALEFLTRAPRDELDRALRSAAETDDQEVRQGAMRLVFTQEFMTLYGKTEADVAGWLELFLDAAYADRIPKNRELVLRRLTEFSQVQAIGVLARAVEDPDQSVRHKAIEALQVRDDPAAATLLRRVADGMTKPRTPRRAGYVEESDDLDSDDGEEVISDREAAKRALQAISQ